MKNRHLSFIYGAVIAVTLLSSAASFGQAGQGRLIGSWKAAIVVTNPLGIQPFTDLLTFATDGSVIETRRLFVPTSPFGALLETPGHGAWQQVGDREYDIHFTFLLQGAADGSDIGTDNVHLRLTLDPTGSVLSGTFESTVKDPSGNPEFTATGTFEGTRI